jgi:hypothetical protein
MTHEKALSGSAGTPKALSGSAGILKALSGSAGIYPRASARGFLVASDGTFNQKP